MNGLRRRGVISTQIGPDIPSGYVELEYLQGNAPGTEWGGAYFDSGLTMNSENRVYLLNIIPVFWTHGVVFGTHIYGSDESATHTRLSILNSGTIEYDCYQGNGYGRLLYNISTTSQLWKFEYGNNYIKDQSSGTTLVSGSQSNRTSNLTMYVFAAHTNYSSSPWFTSTHKVVELKIIDNGVPVRWYKPVKRKSDSVCGMWDVINRTFNPSQDANYAFIGGPEKPDPTQTELYLYNEGVWHPNFVGWTNLKDYSDGSYTEYSDRFVLYYPWHGMYSYWSLYTPFDMSAYDTCHIKYSLTYSSQGSVGQYARMGTTNTISISDHTVVQMQGVGVGGQQVTEREVTFPLNYHNYFVIVFGLAHTLTIHKIRTQY